MQHFLLAGHRGLVDRVFGSRDRDHGFKSQQWQSGFSVDFFLRLHFLHHDSIKSVVCPVWSLFEVRHYCGINSKLLKKSFRDQLVIARGGLYKKNPSSIICRAKTWIKVRCLGPIKTALAKLSFGFSNHYRFKYAFYIQVRN